MSEWETDPRPQRQEKNETRAATEIDTMKVWKEVANTNQLEVKEEARLLLSRSEVVKLESNLRQSTIFLIAAGCLCLQSKR